MHISLLLISRDFWRWSAALLFVDELLHSSDPPTTSQTCSYETVFRYFNRIILDVGIILSYVSGKRIKFGPVVKSVQRIAQSIWKVWYIEWRVTRLFVGGFIQTYTPSLTLALSLSRLSTPDVMAYKFVFNLICRAMRPRCDLLIGWFNRPKCHRHQQRSCPYSASISRSSVLEGDKGPWSSDYGGGLWTVTETSRAQSILVGIPFHTKLRYIRLLVPSQLQ